MSNKSNPEWGYLLDFDPTTTVNLHDFCGPNELAGATCPDCSKSLLRIMSLSAADGRLNINSDKTPAVHLLYCWTCHIPYATFSYRILSSGAVELLKLPPTQNVPFGPEGPYAGYTGQFPLRRVALTRLTAENQQRQRAAQVDQGLATNLYPEQSHQVGGFPVILNDQPITCPGCSRESPFLAVICDDASGNKPGRVPPHDSFTDNCGTQMVFHFCRDCSIVSAYHSND